MRGETVATSREDASAAMKRGESRRGEERRGEEGGGLLREGISRISRKPPCSRPLALSSFALSLALRVPTGRNRIRLPAIGPRHALPRSRRRMDGKTPAGARRTFHILDAENFYGRPLTFIELEHNNIIISKFHEISCRQQGPKCNGVRPLYAV